VIILFDKKIRITMFGGFRIYCDDVLMFESLSKPSKPFELLAMILLSDKDNVSAEELMQSLWADDSSVVNPEGALKNNVYLLRKALKSIDENTEFIITKNGGYAWNDDIPMRLDVKELEKINTQIDNNKLSSSLQVELGKEALDIYIGDILPGLEMSSWLVFISHYYHVMYMNIVYRLCSLLSDIGTNSAYEDIITIANKAAFIEPVSEKLYIYMFRSMKQLNMKEAVINFYPVANNMYYEEAGEQLSSEIKDIYLWASHGNIHTELDLRRIKNDLEEVTKKDKPLQGAYFCQYDNFKHMYHIIARGAERVGNSVALILLTLTTKDALIPPKKEAITSMMTLKTIVQKSLRKGDVFSQFSQNQIIVMISIKHASDCELIQNRFASLYEKINSKNEMMLKISNLVLDPITISQKIDEK
jgi:DNA-binding SARP family transcriptional activator